MNIQLISRYLGHFTWAMAVLMLPSLAWTPYFGEGKMALAFLGSMAIAGAVGWGLTRYSRNAPERMFQREGLALVGLGWLLLAGIAALPYVLRGWLGPVDAYFEAMSGLTTTGSTILTDIEATPKSLLFWRSFTHWIGGMGIIVLFVAVLPYLGAGGKQLFKSESPGPDPRGLSPRIKDTASILYKIYFGLTVVQTVLLMMADMSFYDALCHTFATLATGGFSPRADSVAAFNSPMVETIIIVFMVLAGTNFTLFFVMMRGHWKAPFQDTEWRVYIAVLVLATMLITLNLLGVQGAAELPEPPQATEYTASGAFRVAAFQVVSIMTTTGFCTDDFELWPQFSRALLVVLMFVGGCAGSTGGGLKVVRIIMLLKMAYWRLEKTFRPKTIRTVRVNEAVIDEDVQKTVYGFFVLYIFIFAFGGLFMSFLGLPFQTAFTSVAATLNNIGPGLEHVGAIENYAFISAPGKLFLSLCMVMGRLELFSICVLFLPGFWRRG
jgi:trk system potassium uptake protein